MPRILNTQSVQGNAGSGVSYNDRLVVPNAGTPAFVNPNLIVMNALLPGETQWLVASLVPGGVAQPMWSPGADVIKAGAGTIAAGLTNVDTRLSNAAGMSTFPGMLPLDVDRNEGTALLYTLQEGANIRIYYNWNNTGQPNAQLATGPLGSARCLANIVTWVELDGNVWTAKCYDLVANHPVIVQTMPGNVYQAVVFTWDGAYWVLYSTQNGSAYLHPVNNTSVGFKTPWANNFGLDVEVQPSGIALVESNANNGQSAGSLQTIQWEASNAGPITPPVVAPTPPEVDEFEERGFGPWYATSVQYGCGDWPGNLEALVVSSDGTEQVGTDNRTMVRKRRIMADVQSVAASQLLPGDLLGVLVAKSETQSLAQRVEETRELVKMAKWGVGLIPYTDRRRFDDETLDIMKIGDVAALQVYFSQSDSGLAAFEREVSEEIARVVRRGFLVMLVLGFSDRGFMKDDLLLALMPVYDRLMRQHGVIGGSYFSAMRGTGIIDHPALRPWVEAFAAAAGPYDLDWPTPITPPKPEPPKPEPPKPQPPIPPQETPMQQLAFCQVRLVTFQEQPTFDQHVTVEPHPDQNGLSALKYVDAIGGYASFYNGNWKREPTAGAGERFMLNGNTMTAYRQGQNPEFSVFACQGAAFLS